MKLNIAKLRLVGLVSFGLFLAFAFLRLFTETGIVNATANTWDSKLEILLIEVSVCCFLVISSMQVWNLIRNYYIKKEDLHNSELDSDQM